MAKKILHVESIKATDLLSQFEELKKEVSSIKNHLQKVAPLELLRRKKVKRLLGVSYVTLNDWARKGILPTYKIGNLVYYKRSDIENAMIAIKPNKAEVVQSNFNHIKKQAK